jgi:hypothetical protein
VACSLKKQKKLVARARAPDPVQTPEKQFWLVLKTTMHLGPVWFLVTICQAKAWLTIKVWQPQKVWLKNLKPNFGKNWQK